MPLRVFISYRWESDAHKDKVVEFAQTLRVHWGYDACIDLFETQQEDLWPNWMQRQVSEAAFVLVVASPAYKRAVEAARRSEEEGGLGVMYEWRFIQQELHRGGGQNQRFIPILLDGTSRKGAIPDLLDGYTCFSCPSDLPALHRRIQGTPEIEPEPLGVPPSDVAPPPGTCAMPPAVIRSDGATPRGIPRQVFEEWRTLLDRSPARRTLTRMLGERRHSLRAVVYGAEDQALFLLRTWLRKRFLVEYVEHKLDGEFATTCELWDSRTRGALKAPDAHSLDEALALGTAPAAIVYDISDVQLRHVSALIQMLRERLCPAIKTRRHPLHIIVFHAESPGGKGEARRVNLRREIRALLDAEPIHVEPPSFEDIVRSLADLEPNVDVERLKNTYNRAKTRGFLNLAKAIHEELRKVKP